jgi:hypothetical protein
MMTEEEIIDRLRVDSETFRKIEDEHRNLDLLIDELSKKHYLTAEEDVKKKSLQKEKLFKKDRIAEMIRDYKKTSN